jgi:hypothetical protein
LKVENAGTLKMPEALKMPAWRPTPSAHLFLEEEGQHIDRQEQTDQDHDSALFPHFPVRSPSFAPSSPTKIARTARIHAGRVKDIVSALTEFRSRCRRH